MFRVGSNCRPSRHPLCSPSATRVVEHPTHDIGHLPRREGAAPFLDAMRERSPPFSPEDLRAEFAGLFKDYGVPRSLETVMPVCGLVKGFNVLASNTRYLLRPKTIFIETACPY